MLGFGGTVFTGDANKFTAAFPVPGEAPVINITFIFRFTYGIKVSTGSFR